MFLGGVYGCCITARALSCTAWCILERSLMSSLYIENSVCARTITWKEHYFFTGKKKREKTNK